MTDAAAKEAWILVDMLIENPDRHGDVLVGGRGFYESAAWHIAKAIREAVEAERKACADDLRALIRDDATGNEEVGYMQGLEAGAKAIEERE